MITIPLVTSETGIGVAMTTSPGSIAGLMLPVSIVIVDTEEKVRAFVEELDGLVTEGVVMVDQVEVVTYVGRGRAGTGSAG